jgi:leucyl-tRNA synthetase
MVFSGPPVDDVDWADVAPAALQRFCARALRLADDVGPAGDPASGVPRGTGAGGRAHALRRTTHRTVHDAADLLERDRFNVVVARVMELVTAARRAIDTGAGPGEDPAAHAAAVREAVEVVAVLLSLFAPCTAEEMWERLGHAPSVSEAGWPQVDPGLLVEATVEAVVQVDGKVRDRVTVAPDVDAETLRESALATDGVARATAGRDVVRVVVRPPRVVNLVTRPREATTAEPDVPATGASALASHPTVR